MLDQYFTTNTKLLDDINFIVSSSIKPNAKILEPSCGKLDIINHLIKNKVINENYENITAIEIDKKLKQPEWFKGKYINEDFLEFDFKEEKFDLIIGNPPFCLASEFINKCLDLMNDDSVFIFIVPENTFKKTSNINLLDKLNKMGTFKHYYKYSDEHMFSDASVSVIMFSFMKSAGENKLMFKLDDEDNIEMKYEINPLLTLISDNEIELVKFGDYFDIYVGFVSGADSILKINENDSIKSPFISILKSEGKIERFYDYNDVDSANKNKKMIDNKKLLIDRKIGKFNEKNWFVYGLKRNEKSIKENIDKNCIYVYCQSRKNKIAFVGKVMYFGSNLLCCIPKKEINLDAICDYINKDNFKNNHITSGNKFTISHRQLQESYIIPPTTKPIDKSKPNLKTKIIYSEVDIDEYGILLEIVDYLKRIVNMDELHAGRESGKENELKIIQVIKKLNLYEIYTRDMDLDDGAEDRSWFDFAIVIDDNRFIPVNIKTTTGKSADNSGSLVPIIYSLTNFDFKLDKFYNSNQMINYLKYENIKDNSRDYWYIVVNTKTKEIFTNSFKGLSVYNINFSNLPLQIQWNKNKSYELKTSHEVYNKYLTELGNKKLNKVLNDSDTWQNVLCNMSVKYVLNKSDKVNQNDINAINNFINEINDETWRIIRMCKNIDEIKNLIQLQNNEQN